MEIITHSSVKEGVLRRKKIKTKKQKYFKYSQEVLRSVEWVGALIWNRGGGFEGEHEGYKILTSSYNQSQSFPAINQLFSTPQAPHFALPNSFHKLHCASATLHFLVLTNQVFSLHFMICYISSHPIKRESKI